MDLGAETHLIEWLRSVVGSGSPATDELAAAIHENPGRISRGYQEILAGYKSDPSVILKATLPLQGEEFPGIVTAEEVPFLSICAHHFLPFHGSVKVTYQPGSSILGIGKLPRLVQCRARRFQLQETLARDICRDLILFGGAAGARVDCVAHHLCVCYRGVSQAAVANRVVYALGTLIASVSDRPSIRDSSPAGPTLP